MALTVPDVARFTIHGVWTNGHSCDTVLDMQLDTTGSVLTREAALQDLADDVIQNWQSQIMHQLPNNYTVLGIHFIDLDEEDGATGDRPIDAGETATGLLTDPACPPNVAVLVKKLTTSGRGSRSGRMYLPGIEEANVSEDGVIGNSTIDALQAACDDFLDNINNDSGGPIDWTSRLVVVHLEPRPAPPLPDNRVGTYTAVSSLAVQSTVATQRRRLRQVAVRTARISGPLLLAGATTDFACNPEDSNQTYLIKWIVACNVSGTTRTLTIGHVTASGAHSTFRKQSMAAGFSFSEPAFIVLEPGECLEASGAVDNAIVLGMFGAILAGVAY